MSEVKAEILQDLKGLFSKHGEREVAEAVFRKVLEPAVDRLANEVPSEFRLLGASGATVAKAYLEKALGYLDKKIGGDDGPTQPAS